MKFILLLAVVVAVLWLARRGLKRVPGRDDEPPPPLPTPLEMVACRQCGLNVPLGDAVQGSSGVFCTEAHRVAFEQARP